MYLEGRLNDFDFQGGSDYSSSTLDTLIPDKTSQVYICGPSGFISDSIKHLDAINVPAANVMYEHFGPLSD